MLSDASAHAAHGLDQGIDEWVNLTPREMMDCYNTVCQGYRTSLAARHDLPDLEHRVKIMYEALVERNIVLFYFCQRYPRLFHHLTTRTVPEWFWRSYLFHFFQTQVFVEQGIMTIEERIDSIDRKFQELKPETDDWQRPTDDVKTFLLKPSKMELTPEIAEAIRIIHQIRRQ
jgi:hypothetical protein